MADYFDLPHLKYHAGRALKQTLNSSNSISTYRLAKTYHCEELARHTKEYVDLNFTNVAKTDEFLGLPYQDVKKWLSSDELVNAEEDVFEIILRWTGYKNGERNKYFADLFRGVRLNHVPRDFPLSDVVTNDLVNGNKPCLNLVKNLVAVIDPKDHCYLKAMPWRRPHGQPVIVVRVSLNKGYAILCYQPRDNAWLLGAKAIFIPRKTRGRSMYTMPGSSDALDKKKLRVKVRKLRPRSSPLGTFREEERLLLAKRSQRRGGRKRLFSQATTYINKFSLQTTNFTPWLVNHLANGVSRLVVRMEDIHY